MHWVQGIIEIYELRIQFESFIYADAADFNSELKFKV